MRLKVKKTTGLVRTLPILDTFEVDVRHLTRQERDALHKRCSKIQYNNGQMQEVLDDQKFARDASRTYIAEGRGLSNSIIRQLGVPLEEDLPTNGDGFVPCDEELLEDLFREAHANKFAVPILNFSADMLAIVELEQKKSVVGSDSSSGSTGTSPV